MVNYGRKISSYFVSLTRELVSSKLVTDFVRLARKVVLPGFDGVPLYDVAVFFIKGIQKGALTMRAAAFSYNFFLALFPAIIFLFTIIPYIPILGFQDNLLAMMQEVFPHSTFDAVEDTLFDIVKRPRGGLLSVGFILAAYFATNGIYSLMVSFNQTYHTIETRSWIKIRLISILLVLILSLMLIIAIVLITVGPLVIDFLANKNMIRDSFVYYLIIAGKWLVTIALLFFVYSFLYYFAPARRSRFRFISAGSTLATVLTILTSIGFNFYVTNFSKYNSLYGSIGTLIIVMLWIYFNALIVLIGFELNVSIMNAGRRKSGTAPKKYNRR